MGMADPETMTAGIAAVAGLDLATVATITVDSYTRVGDHAAAARAVASGLALNGFPLVSHGAERTARVAAAAGHVPVQVRHGSAAPGAIFRMMGEAGLTASEGGPVSYCLPYGRTPLAEAVAHWAQATDTLGELVRHRGGRAHLETFGGCLLGQLCPPSLLVAMSLLEAMFFVQHGVDSVSLSYAQQTHPVQDIEALAALDHLAAELLPAEVDRHLVLYTYMGVFPRTPDGARSLLADSARIAVLGGARRLIVKTEAEAHRIPTIEENLSALIAAARQARLTRQEALLPDRNQVDHSLVLDEARQLVHAVRELSDDIGRGLVAAFASGLLDVPYCLHADNAGLARGGVDADGRLYWALTGNLPLPARSRRPGRPVTSAGLLRMLNHTAERYDRAAVAAPSPSVTAGERGQRIAVVGSGPRGLSVVERLAARAGAAPGGRPLEVWLIDDVEVGCGRIWRTDQSPWLLMNTAAGEVTMFSGPPDDGPPRAGAGPSLAQWWAGVDAEQADPDGYAPRAVYGRYLRYVLDRVEENLPPRVTVHRVRARVEDLARAGSTTRWTLHLHDGQKLDVERVVLTTGHPRSEPPAERRRLADLASARPDLTYLSGDSTADLPLGDIPAGTDVGIIGLGLSFYDVLAELTLGRGGRFTEDGAGGRLRYRQSGREPVLVAGSRAGVPLRARGRNQKLPDHRYRPRIFTADRIRRLRAAGPLDFGAVVLPLLQAEIDLVHALTLARRRWGEAVLPWQLTDQELIRDVDRRGPGAAVAAVRRTLGVDDVPPPDLEALARPFRGRSYASRDAYHDAVRAWIDDDLAEAALGNVSGPLKAALDVVRDVRGVLREAVDFGGLTPQSHADFLRRFVPIASFVSTGPPMLRLAQARALLDAGVLVLAGPDARFEPAPVGFVIWSPHVTGSARVVRTLVDARTPVPDLGRDLSGLTRRLHSRGVLTTWSNTSGAPALPTGGVAVTTAPFHPVGLEGADPSLYVLGIPTEFTRWFTQVGSGRPEVRTGFHADADAIATDLLDESRAPTVPATRHPPQLTRRMA
jgi:methylaspartate mutase epsilon subunit